MTTITEDYVSFEIAKLLKSKKFHIPTRSHYDGRGGFGFFDICEIDWNNYKCFRERRCYSAPTLQMAMKWLRKMHNIQIELNWDKGNQLYSFQIWKPGKYQPEISSLDLWRIYKNDNYLGEWNHEKACEEAIRYCLENLI